MRPGPALPGQGHGRRQPQQDLPLLPGHRQRLARQGQAGRQRRRETAYRLTRTAAKGKIALHRLANDELKNPAGPQASGTFSHTKYLLIEGSYKGVKDQKLIFTGSHTYTGMALTSNDEALLKYESAPVHDAYVLNFREQRAAADAEARYGGAE